MRIFLEISRRLNFTWTLYEPEDSNKWGKKLENGSYSGGVAGDLFDRRSDMGFCFLWLTSPKADDLDFTFPWNSVCNTFLVPRAQPLHQLLAVFYPFTASLWALLAISVVFMSLLQWTFQKIRGLGQYLRERPT